MEPTGTSWSTGSPRGDRSAEWRRTKSSPRWIELPSTRRAPVAGGGRVPEPRHLRGIDEFAGVGDVSRGPGRRGRPPLVERIKPGRPRSRLDVDRSSSTTRRTRSGGDHVGGASDLPGNGAAGRRAGGPDSRGLALALPGGRHLVPDAGDEPSVLTRDRGSGAGAGQLRTWAPAHPDPSGHGRADPRFDRDGRDLRGDRPGAFGAGVGAWDFQTTGGPLSRLWLSGTRNSMPRVWDSNQRAAGVVLTPCR